MIIECQTCHARFRLDETKIKGRGARVKCRKCGEGIIVLKDGGAGFSPPDAVRQGSPGIPPRGIPERDAAPEGTPDNLIPFPGSARPEEVAPSVEAASPPATPVSRDAEAPFPPLPSEEKDEVDLAFERILMENRQPAVAETSAGAAEAPSPAEPGPALAESDLHAPVLEPEPGPGIGPDLAPPPSGARTPAEAAPASGEAGGFLLSDAETLDFLKADRRSDPAGGSTDISLSISSTPFGEEAMFPGELPPPPEEPQGAGGPPQEEFLVQGNVNPEAVSPAEFDAPPPREAEPPPPPPAERIPRRDTAAEEPPRKKPSSPLAAGLALLFLLAAVAGYFGFTDSGRRLAERAVPGAAGLWGGKPAAAVKGRYEVKNVIGYYESGAASPRILVIKGQVANLSSREKSGVRVLAALLDNTDKVLAEQAVYAGNLLTGEALRAQSRESMSKTLGNRFGVGLTNMNIPPGKSIPFMVVFFDAPATMDSYKLEAKDGE